MEYIIWPTTWAFLVPEASYAMGVMNFLYIIIQFTLYNVI